MYRQLAPGPWFNSVDVVTYGKFYAEILARLDPHQVAADLAELAQGRIPTLLCFERATGRDFCHKSLVASWLSEALGQPVPEFGFEHLAQQQHPLLPTALPI